MDLFRPFLGQRKARRSTLSADASRAAAIFVLSFNHLRALTLYYQITFATRPESHTIAWIHGPLYVASSIISYEHQRSQRSSLTLCMQAFSKLLDSHAVVSSFVKGLYGMAVEAGVLTATEARDQWDNISTQRSIPHRLGHSETSVVIDQDLAMEDRAAAVGDKLAEAFDELMLFEDYVDLDQAGGSLKKQRLA